MTLVKEMPVSAVARILGETDKRLWRVVEHYVELGLEKQNLKELKKVGIDETASKKGHKYVSLFVDLEKSNVVYVAEGKNAETVEGFSKHLDNQNGKAETITAVSCDMSPAFIKGVGEELPNAKITFDRFHIMKIINKAVDCVRREEVLSTEELKHTRYIWLKNPENLTEKQEKTLNNIENTNLKTVLAYQIKLAFQNIFKAEKETAEKNLTPWYNWVMDNDLKPMKKSCKDG